MHLTPDLHNRARVRRNLAKADTLLQSQLLYSAWEGEAEPGAAVPQGTGSQHTNSTSPPKSLSSWNRCYTTNAHTATLQLSSSRLVPLAQDTNGNADSRAPDEYSPAQQTHGCDSAQRSRPTPVQLQPARPTALQRERTAPDPAEIVSVSRRAGGNGKKRAETV